MKSIIALVLLCCMAVAFASSCSYTHGDGRPGCKTPAELRKVWRNNWDPTRYWICAAPNTPGKLVLCPMSHGFLDSAQKCVHFGSWVWTPPCDPPSKA